MKLKNVLAVLAAAAWISVSEFVRNQFLIKQLWVQHYQSMNLVFPDAPLNGAIWGVWALLFAISIFIMSRKFSLTETTMLSWLVAFVLMWVVIGNLGVLPKGLMLYAVPLSILECFVASLLITQIAPAGPQVKYTA